MRGVSGSLTSVKTEESASRELSFLAGLAPLLLRALALTLRDFSTRVGSGFRASGDTGDDAEAGSP